MVAVLPQPPPTRDGAPAAAEHFRRWYYAAILHVVDGLLAGADDPDDVLSRFPFLVGYLSELALHGLDGLSLAEGRLRWHTSLRDWEDARDEHLPLRALPVVAGDDLALTLLLVAGLGEEDGRFGALVEALQETPGARRPTVGLLTALGGSPSATTSPRISLRALVDAGLLQVSNPEAPRSEWVVQVPPALWEALRGERYESPTPWLHYQPPATLRRVSDLILPEELGARLRSLPSLLAQGEIDAIVVRGPCRGGRRTLIGAIARELGCGILTVVSHSRPTEEQWRLLGPLATALHALPVVRLDPAPGETIDLLALTSYDGPLGITLGPRGGVAGPAVQQAIEIAIELPGPALRGRHWRDVFAGHPQSAVDELSERFRLTGGTIRRAAAIAQSHATLDGRQTATTSDVRTACAGLNREALDTLATHLQPLSSPTLLAVEPATSRDLADLERRCRHRERIGTTVSPALGEQLTPGVRALFTGPSGTGKTLAARLLGASLGLDVYRIDLSAVVNKYIGETEKRLDEVFARAEELDVIVLLDEGDALLTARTAVQNANDRYANLETNFLLQRLESFGGILVVTTNAGDRIDAAFQRRMDVVVQFRAPGPAERLAIWTSHLPASHAVDPAFLQLMARRCELHGGQIRNAVLHAALLALDAAGTIDTHQLEAAVLREYRKANTPCPLRLTPAMNGRRG